MLSLIIFLALILCLITRPFGLGIGTFALLGAFASIALGLVSLADCLEAFSIVWDASLSFLGIIIFSLVLDEIGFFEYLAYKAARLCGARLKVLFVVLMLLCAVISALFANDAAVLIFSPIILAQARILDLSAKATLALLLATGFMSDSASLLFVFSNLTNIITAGYFKLSFWGYALDMSVPFIASVLASTIIAYFLCKKSLSSPINTQNLKTNYQFSANKQLFIFSWIFLGLLLLGYALGDIYGLPFCVCALGGALLFFAFALRLGAVSFKATIKRTPWQILWFSLGLYIVVWGLKNAGYNELLAGLLKSENDFIATMLSGMLASVLSSLMNNLPAMMLMDIALSDTSLNSAIYAAIVGCNVGVKFTPFGSLATLLWLYILRQKGCEISIKSYLIFNFLLTLPVLFITLIAVYLWV